MKSFKYLRTLNGAFLEVVNIMVLHYKETRFESFIIAIFCVAYVKPHLMG